MIKVALAAFVTLLSFPNAQSNGWVDQLRNQNENVCCFDYDGHRLENPDWDTSSLDAHPYKVKHDGEWVSVPAWAVVTMRNQDGIARVWWNATSDDNGNFVRCFLPGSLS